MPVFFFGCDNTNSNSNSGGSGLSGGKLTIKVEDFDDYDYLDEVIAYVSNANGDEKEVGNASFKKSFTLTLDDPVKKNLSKVGDYIAMIAYYLGFDEDDVDISDESAYLGDLAIYGFCDDDYAGEFLYYKESKNSYVEGGYIYADKAVKITYKEDDININLSLKKGWNAAFMTEGDDDSFEFSTKAVSGLKWYFEEGEGGGGGGGYSTAVRFRKAKDYTYITALALVNSSDQILASHQFGTNAGTSSYFGIPSGTFMPLMYYTYPGEEGWFYFLDEPGTYNFRDGRAYTITIDDNGSSIMGYVTDDGAYSKSSVISKKFVSKRKSDFSKEVNIQKIELNNINVKF